MRFLGDESCDFIVVKALREAGHDVTVVAEIGPRAKDSEVICGFVTRVQRIMRIDLIHVESAGKERG